MLKKITEPQALYNKDTSASPQPVVSAQLATPAVMAQPSHTPRNQKKGLNMKMIGGVVAFAIILVVGIAGIMIAQRQRQVDGPVAPTAPESQPAAQETPTTNACTLQFTVAELAAAKCVSKTAKTATNQPLSARSSVRRGDVIEFAITVSSTDKTKGEVVVEDTLPVGMTYVEGSASAPTASYSATTRTLSMPIGVMDPGQADGVTTILTYKATVADAAPIGEIKNSVTVTTDGDDATESICSLALLVSPEGVAACESKVALTDYTGRTLTSSDQVKPGDTIAYKITVSSTETSKDKVVVTDVLPSMLDFVEARTTGLTYNQANRTLTIDLGTMEGSDREVVEFKAKVSATATTGDIKNIASVKTGTEQAVECENVLKVGSYSCNSSCETNAQCTAVNENYTCAQTSEGRRCRLASNVASTSCEAPAATPTPSPTPTPIPVTGCNQNCETNADCTNSSHICFQTTDGSKRCRLESNVASESCTMPSAAAPVQQPALPEELPQSGPDDWMNWLKAGLITLGIGALLLLLL